MHHLITARDHCVEYVEPRSFCRFESVRRVVQPAQEEIHHSGLVEDIHVIPENVIVTDCGRDALLGGGVADLQPDKDQGCNHRDRRDDRGQEIDLFK